MTSQTLFSDLFNVVVVPTSSYAEGNQTLLLSAMRRDRWVRLVSPPMPESGIREALALAGATQLQIEQLLRGNRMAHGDRRTDYLYFTEEQLTRAGLVPEAPRPEPGDEQALIPQVEISSQAAPINLDTRDNR